VTAESVACLEDLNRRQPPNAQAIHIALSDLQPDDASQLLSRCVGDNKDTRLKDMPEMSEIHI